VGGIIAQKTWVEYIYPWLESGGWLPKVTTLVEGLSRPLEPYVKWRVLPDSFPINSQEIYFIAMFVGVILYAGISLLGSREEFNMGRMLHRGKYRREGEVEVVQEALTLKNAYRKILGIDSQYSRGDRILAWSVFLYSMLWGFGSFLVLVIWNAISPWSDAWWAEWFWVYYLVVPGIIAAVSTVWFTIGGTWDLRRLFKSLAEKEDDLLDDGRVIGHVSADDVARVEEVEDEGKSKREE